MFDYELFMNSRSWKSIANIAISNIRMQEYESPEPFI